MSKNEAPAKKGILEGIVHGVEVVGNMLPHPFWLFMLFIAIIMGLSSMYSSQGMSVTYLAAKAGEAPKETTVAVVNLLSYDYIRALSTNFVKIYAAFAPLGLVVVMMLGVGLAERTGLISALMRKTILGAPAFMITGVLALVGCNAHMASDAGILLMPLIGASVFKAIGVNPWIGIIVGYSTANAGFASGFALAGTDALLSGITQSAAEGMGVSGPTHPMINYYFSFVSVITLTLATVFVTEKFMKKHLGEVALERDENELQKHKLTDDENRGLFFALVTFVLYAAAVLYLTVPQNSLFRAPDGTLVPRSPLLSGIMMLLFLFFSLEGIAYGVGARVIKSFNDVPKLMGDGLRGSVGFMVVVLPAAIFVEMFNASRLGVILSVHGANWLKSLDVGTSTILIVFVVVVIFLDLLVVSGSAKWLILAPIFVPMLAQLGMPPALVQMAYRVGDSVINPMSPISPYMPVILGLMDQYRPTGQTKDAGIGTLLSLCLPYSAIYIVVLLLQLVIWYSLGLPLGPGVPVSM